MADTYIDPFETLIYGAHARAEMRALCVPLVPVLAPMIEYAIERQREVDDAMQIVLAKLPKPGGNPQAIADAADAIERFGNWIASLKDRPLDPKRFFRGALASTVGRRRLPKIVSALEHIIKTLEPHAKGGPDDSERIRGARAWYDELVEVHRAAAELADAQRAARVEEVVVLPAVAAARERWLEAYTANKRLVEGLLRHAGKLDVLPLVFDDLADVQRTKVGTADE